MTDAPPPKTVRELALPLGSGPTELRAATAAQLGVDLSALGDVRVRKVSVDARGKHLRKVYTVDAWRADEDAPPDRTPALRRGSPRLFPEGSRGRLPVIVGTGPAGLWAALRLLEAGLPSILLDRGGALPDRHAAVRGLRRDGVLDPESNLCFGAGGAGTYSDGKLYTRRRDPEIQRIYEDLAALGAPTEILVEAHPHVGTNRLIKMLARLEDFLRDSGCEIRYGAKVTGLVRDAAGTVAGVRMETGEELPSPAVILATGHSARDVYHWLHAAGVPLAMKPFAIGARCEHQQAHIDQLQFGPHAGNPALEPAEYFLTAQVGPRGVYSFCMCPGGFVIPTTTELGRLNVNGMSNHRRGSDFANAALVVTVEPADFWIDRPGDLAHLGPLAGLAFQRHLETRAFEAGGGAYHAPAQRLTDFLAGRSGTLPDRTSYRPGLTPSDLRTVLPERLHPTLARGVLRFEQKMRGFLTEEAVLIGVETTTSSPIRILRDDTTLATPGFPGLYPCGEGAGQAGGIVSSALDGLRVAEAVLAAVDAATTAG
jgi:hypothetical protein